MYKHTKIYQGQIQDFHWGAGRKDYVGVHTHHMCEAWSPLWPGSRARLKALEALGGWGQCSLVLSEPYLLSFWYKMGFKKTIVDNMGGGGCCSPLWICHCLDAYKMHHFHTLEWCYMYLAIEIRQIHRSSSLFEKQKCNIIVIIMCI